MNRRFRSNLSVSKSSLRRWAVLFFLLASAVFTYLLMANVEQFYVVNQQALEDPNFIHADHYWKHSPKDASLVSYSGDGISIENGRLTSNKVVQQLDVSSPLFLRLSVDLEGKKIVTDKKKPFAGASAGVDFYGKEGARLKYNTIVNVKKSMPKRTYSEILYVDKTVDSVRVALRLTGAEGVMTVRNPELSVLAEFPIFKITRALLAAFWCFVGIWLVYLAVKKLPLNSLVIAGGLSVVIVVGVLMPGGIIATFNESIFSVLPSGIAVAVEQLLAVLFSSGDTKAPWAGLSKIAHLLVFFFVGVMAGRGFRNHGVVYGIAMVVVFAVVTEALQTLVFGRSASLRDVYIDSIGGVLGLLSVITYVVMTEKLREYGEPI